MLADGTKHVYAICWQISQVWAALEAQFTKSSLPQPVLITMIENERNYFTELRRHNTPGNTKEKLMQCNLI